MKPWCDTEWGELVWGGMSLCEVRWSRWVGYGWIIPCPIIPYRNVSYHIVPYHTLLHDAPSLAPLPVPTMLYRAIPCPLLLPVFIPLAFYDRHRPLRAMPYYACHAILCYNMPYYAILQSPTAVCILRMIYTVLPFVIATAVAFGGWGALCLAEKVC